MKFEVYCDESCPEVLKDKNANKFLILGSIWLPSDYRVGLKEEIQIIKEKHNYRNEMKWNKVAPSTVEFYKEILHFFFNSENIRFRSLLVEADKVDMVKFHNNDGELSFYKFYYQLLHHWILGFNEYSIFVDHKVNKDRNRVHELWKVLKNANLFAEIANVQALPSNESVGIQLADFLMGIVNGKFNAKVTSAAKLEVIAETEKILGRPISQTHRAEEKFNVFKINLQGGW